VNWSRIFSHLKQYDDMGKFRRPYMRKAKFGKDVVILKYSDNTKPYDTGESFALKMVDHENVVKLQNIHILPDSLGSVIVLPFVESIEFKPQTSTDAVNYFKQLLSALSQCHEYALCHHDVKPSNVLYDKTSNRPILIDFGNYLWGAVSERFSRGIGCSTLIYSPPETLVPDETRSHSLGPEVDMWSLGVMVAELLRGKRLFTPASAEALLQRQKEFVSSLSRASFEKEMTSPSLLNDGLWRLIKGTLVIDPTQRVSAEDALTFLDTTSSDVASSFADGTSSDVASSFADGSEVTSESLPETSVDSKIAHSDRT